MAFSLIANIDAGSTNGSSVTTGSIDTSGANLLVTSVADGNSTNGTLSDSKGNTWSLLTLYPTTPIGSRTRLRYVANPTVGSGHTFSVSSTNTYPTIFVQAWSGADASPFDVQNGSNTTGVTSIQPGSVTPSEDNCLIVTGHARNANATASINSSFTISDNEALVGAQHYGGGMAYLVQTTAAAVNPTWSWASSAECSSAIAVFKSSGVVVEDFIPRVIFM